MAQGGAGSCGVDRADLRARHFGSMHIRWENLVMPDAVSESLSPWDMMEVDQTATALSHLGRRSAYLRFDSWLQKQEWATPDKRISARERFRKAHHDLRLKGKAPDPPRAEG